MGPITFDDVELQLFNMTLECIHQRAMTTGRLNYRDVQVLYFWFVTEQHLSSNVLFLEIMGHATLSTYTRATVMSHYWRELEALVD